MSARAGASTIDRSAFCESVLRQAAMILTGAYLLAG